MILMSYSYKPFPLDAWISKFYQEIGIFTPRDINEQYIARSLRIFLTYSEKRCYSTQTGNFKMINIHEGLNPEKKRETFFHELCHLLRHEGNQYAMMPEAFRELQEREANHFTRYAAIPFHMLNLMDWRSPTLVHDISETFQVSEEVSEYRVQQVFRNMKPKKRVENQ